MFEQTFETSATPHITVRECWGSLVVRGTEERQITLRALDGADSATVVREGETFTLTARTDCVLTCPPATTITANVVQGSLEVRDVEGPVTIGTAHGTVELRDVGPTALEQVFGNLNVRQVTGDVQAQAIRGNARVRQVEGSASLNQVDGNLTAEGLEGGLEAGRVQGNVRVGPPFTAGKHYRLRCSGNLTALLPADTSLSLALRAAGGVRSHVTGLALDEVEGEMRGVLGEGEARLEAQASGRISLRPLDWEEGLAAGAPFAFGFDPEELEAQIQASITSAMAEVNARLEESLGRFGGERLHERMQREAERAAERARQATERTVERARREAEREAERARLRAERAERRWQRASGWRPHPKEELVADEERMQVLRMVEAGKITPEQAAELLAALEGR